MSSTYMTSSGDTWDAIALKVYGNEKYTEHLMNNNQDRNLLATILFDAGTVLNTPELTATEQASVNQPPWRTT